MLNSLNCMLFGASGQEEESTGNSASAAKNDAAAPSPQGSQAPQLNTTEDEMGWLLVDVSRSSTPPLPETQGEDTPLRGPDGTAFDGVLDLSSPSVSDSEDAEADQSKMLAEHASDQPLDHSEENHADMSSSCSSLSVISESHVKESDPMVNHIVQTPVQHPRLPCDTLNESWMLTPPPCFTGTDVNNPVTSSPHENRLIENISFYRISCVYRTREEIKPRFLERHSWLIMETVKEFRRNILMAIEAREAQLQIMERLARDDACRAQCCRVSEKKGIIQREAAARKLLNRSSTERSNKAQMAHSCSRKQMSARNRLLRPSGGKCGRFSQRSQ